MTQTRSIADPAPTHPAFLTAEWRYLAMLNYAVDPAILEPLVPLGTQLDLWHDKTYVSLVGFLFLNTRVRGLSIPFHRNFEEVNLRFYVLRPHPAGDRRGVVFIREIVPRRAIATVARRLYNENYCCMPMRHQITHDPLAVEYAWRCDRRRWCNLRVRTRGGEPQLPAPDSHESFIVEHYWGYTRQRDNGCSEYRVEHPPWRIWASEEARFDADVEALYGRPFAEALSKPPVSAFVADGSAITVRKGVRIC